VILLDAAAPLIYSNCRNNIISFIDKLILPHEHVTKYFLKIEFEIANNLFKIKSHHMGLKEKRKRERQERHAQIMDAARTVLFEHDMPMASIKRIARAVNSFLRELTRTFHET